VNRNFEPRGSKTNGDRICIIWYNRLVIYSSYRRNIKVGTLSAHILYEKNIIIWIASRAVVTALKSVEYFNANNTAKIWDIITIYMTLYISLSPNTRWLRMSRVAISLFIYMIYNDTYIMIF